MTDLVAWLRRQIDEDEIAWEMVAARDVVELLHGEPLAPRMLAEVAAKRKLLDEYEAASRDPDTDPEVLGYAAGLDVAVQHISQGFAGRPGWREEWAT